MRRWPFRSTLRRPQRKQEEADQRGVEYEVSFAVYLSTEDKNCVDNEERNSGSRDIFYETV